MKKKILLGIIFIGLLFFSFLYFMSSTYGSFRFSGNGMLPTIPDNQNITIRKGATPNRNDIVLFTAPPAAYCPEGTGCDFLKRVVGIPGDTIQIKNNTVIVNGVVLAEPYLAPGSQTADGTFFADGKIVTVGPNEYIVLGDNRPHSSDSRAWGPVTRDLIIGVMKR